MRKFFAPLAALTFAVAATGVYAAPEKPAQTSVVASQGGAEVRLSDIDAAASAMPAGIRQQVFADPHRVESLIRSMLADKQLVAEADKLGLEKQPAVQQAMHQAATAALVKARVDALRAKVDAAAPDMTELAHERYLANPAEFKVAEKVDVKHILIGTKDRSDTEAKALADKLYADLKRDPAQFDADVEKYSDDQSKSANHGLIPDATGARWVEPFRTAAGKLTKVGDIVGPVKSQFGYHILELVKLTPAHQKSFDDVKTALVKQLHDDYVSREVRDYLDGVRNRKLDANMELVESLTTRYATPAAPAAAGAKK